MDVDEVLLNSYEIFREGYSGVAKEQSLMACILSSRTVKSAFLNRIIYVYS